MLQFEEIYSKHNKMVYNLALQYVQNIEDAEEISQDVFLSVYNSLDQFKQTAQISTWLYRITINKCLDFIKAKKRKKRFSFFNSIFQDKSNEIKHDISNFDHPGVLMEHKEALEEIFSLINQLADNQKTVLILNKIEDKKIPEIAEIMQLSNKAVESLLQRAKSNLSKKIESNK